MITEVISVALYLTDKGEHTMLYKFNNNVYIKTSALLLPIPNKPCGFCGR